MRQTCFKLNWQQQEQGFIMKKIISIRSHETLVWILIIVPVSFLTGALINDKEIDLNLIVTSLITLAAVAVGAYLAFLYSEHQASRRKKDKWVALTKIAQLKLSRILGYYEQLLPMFPDEVPNEIYQNFVIGEFPEMPDYEHLKFNIDELYFILDSNDPNLLNELTAIQESFYQLIRLIDERTMMLKEKIQPVLEQKGYRTGKQIIDQQLESDLGERLFEIYLGKCRDITQVLPERYRYLENYFDSFTREMEQFLGVNLFRRQSNSDTQ